MDNIITLPAVITEELTRGGRVGAAAEAELIGALNRALPEGVHMQGLTEVCAPDTVDQTMLESEFFWRGVLAGIDVDRILAASESGREAEAIERAVVTQQEVAELTGRLEKAREERDAALVAAAGLGVTSYRLAQATGLSVPTVWRIIKAHPKD